MDTIAGLMPPMATSPPLTIKVTDGMFGDLLAQIMGQASVAAAPDDAAMAPLPAGMPALEPFAPEAPLPLIDPVVAAATPPPSPIPAVAKAAPASGTPADQDPITATPGIPAMPAPVDAPPAEAQPEGTDTDTTPPTRPDLPPDAPEHPPAEIAAVIALPLPLPGPERAPPLVAVVPTDAQRPAVAARPATAMVPVHPEAPSAATDGPDAPAAPAPGALPQAQALAPRVSGAPLAAKGLAAARDAGADPSRQPPAGLTITSDREAPALPGPAPEGIAPTLAEAAPRLLATERPDRPERSGAAPLEAPPQVAVEAARPPQGRPATETASPAPRPPPQGPALRQITPAVVALAVGGGARLTVTLDPEELGRVEISVERTGETTQVRILAERAETMVLLQRDHRELDRALTQAGVSQEGRALSFGLSAGDGGAGQQQGRHGGAPGRAAWNLQSPDSTPAPAEAPPRRIAVSLLDLAI